MTIIQCDKCGKQGEFDKTIFCDYPGCRKRMHRGCVSIKIPRDYDNYGMVTVCSRHIEWHSAMCYAQETLESLGGKIRREWNEISADFPGLRFILTVETNKKYEWYIDGLGKKTQIICPSQPHNKLILDLKERIRKVYHKRRDDTKKKLERYDKGLELIESSG